MKQKSVLVHVLKALTFAYDSSQLNLCFHYEG